MAPWHRLLLRESSARVPAWHHLKLLAKFLPIFPLTKHQDKNNKNDGSFNHNDFFYWKCETTQKKRKTSINKTVPSLNKFMSMNVAHIRGTPDFIKITWGEFFFLLWILTDFFLVPLCLFVDVDKNMAHSSPKIILQLKKIAILHTVVCFFSKPTSAKYLQFTVYVHLA